MLRAGIGQLLSPVIPVSTVPPLVHHGNPAPINLMPMSEVCYFVISQIHTIISFCFCRPDNNYESGLVQVFSFIVDNVVNQFNFSVTSGSIIVYMHVPHDLVCVFAHTILYPHRHSAIIVVCITLVLYHYFIFHFL